MADSAKGYKTYPEWFTHIEEYTQNLKEKVKNQPVQRQGVIISTFTVSKAWSLIKVFLMDVKNHTLPKGATESDLRKNAVCLCGHDKSQKELSLFLY